jgi:DNA-binding protein H-NS
MSKRPPSMDLSSLTVAELEALAAEVSTRLGELRRRQQEEAFAKLEALAASLGVDEVALAARYGSKRRRRVRAKAVRKYASPTDLSKTWSGRGRQPAWVRDHLAGGGTLEQLLAEVEQAG